MGSYKDFEFWSGFFKELTEGERWIPGTIYHNNKRNPVKEEDCSTTEEDETYWGEIRVENAPKKQYTSYQNIIHEGLYEYKNI